MEINLNKRSETKEDERSLKNANVGQLLDFNHVCYMVDFNRPVEGGKCLEISWKRSQHNERRRGIDLVNFTNKEK